MIIFAPCVCLDSPLDSPGNGLRCCMLVSVLPGDLLRGYVQIAAALLGGRLWWLRFQCAPHLLREARGSNLPPSRALHLQYMLVHLDAR